VAREYGSAEAFRRALEARLSKIAETELVQVNRLRRQVAFDRLLARLFRTIPAPWVLKGGYALELRFKTARATVDIDLTVQVPAAGPNADANQIVREMLQDAASINLADWFDYTVGPLTLDLDAAPYGGGRFPIETRMGGRIFARFHLDAGVGDAIIEPVDVIEGRGWLDFAGIESPQIAVLSQEQQFAEKLHAYTLPRPTFNSRVKDLVDLALLIGSGELAPELLAEAIRITFDRRRTHELPETLPKPPAEWMRSFQALAGENELVGDLDTTADQVAEFFCRLAARRLDD
jgi:hypothetical protein